MSGNRDTYERLIEAASDCFAEKGFAASSIRDISRRAGISQGAMYTYFSGKEELIVAIVLEEQRLALRSYEQETNMANIDRIYDVFLSCVGRKPGYPANHNPLWLEIMAESSRNDELRKHFIESDVVMRKGIEIFLRRGMQTGEFRQNLVTDEATMAIFALLDGLMGRKAINPDFHLEKDLPGFRDLLKGMLS